MVCFGFSVLHLEQDTGFEPAGVHDPLKQCLSFDHCVVLHLPCI